jgi:hypothetical protein
LDNNHEILEEQEDNPFDYFLQTKLESSTKIETGHHQKNNQK